MCKALSVVSGTQQMLQVSVGNLGGKFSIASKNFLIVHLYPMVICS